MSVFDSPTGDSAGPPFEAERPFVSDNPQWLPPSAPPPADSQRAFAEPVGATVPATAPGWTAPPKPGLIPLRPLTLGTLLSASFQVLRRNPRPMFGFALLITGFIYIIGFGIVGLVSVLAFSRLDNAIGPEADAIAAGSFATVLLSALIPVALSVVLAGILQGVVVLEVARGTLGEKLRLGGLWRAARGRIGALIGWTVLASGVAITAIVLVSIVIALIIGFGGTPGLVVGILLGIAASLGAVVVGAWLATRLSLVPSVLMIERLSLRAALGRSWSLTIGFFWKTLGVQLLVVVIIQVVSNIISTPLSLVLGLGAGLINPNGDQSGTIVLFVVVYILTLVVALVFGAITAVVQSATTALIYIDIRMRKEGLDLELSRYVEARSAGATDVPDPYLRTQPTP